MGLVVLGCQCRQEESETLLELDGFCVGSGELAGEPLTEVPQPCDAGLARIGPLARCPGGCPSLLEVLGMSRNRLVIVNRSLDPVKTFNDVEQPAIANSATTEKPLDEWATND
ncbi:hypothetical protein I2W78_39430 [Streptomyces spinoverrucosus]|uniref:hypothetical protein n=1 Tax=Streptomyces spinoverrucosus TaxID=284043 RepID=UPI0018C3559A|nr:hypothetical protein [Streptomyces spinoverrucosus]MBG0857757.1 hypothetical protein [Streptomyces spinoverrucosus]